MYGENNMAKVVCTNATAKCSAGSATSRVICEASVQINGANIATEASSMLPFGVCSITGSSCIPALIAWSVSRKVEILGQNVLTEKSTAACSVGGVVSFDDPGQNLVEVVEITEEWSK